VLASRIACAAGAIGTLLCENVIEGAGTAGIYVTAGADFVRIHNNAITSNNDGVVSFAEHTVITANTLVAVPIPASWSTGHAIVGNNSCHDNGDYGIHINAANAVVVGNQVDENTLDGIYFSGSGDYGLGKGNMCTDNGGDGMACDADQVVLGDNICRGNTGYGIDYSADRDIVLGTSS